MPSMTRGRAIASFRTPVPGWMLFATGAGLGLGAALLGVAVGVGAGVAIATGVGVGVAVGVGAGVLAATDVLDSVISASIGRERGAV